MITVTLAMSLEGDAKSYFQWHSFFLVIGGTISILIFSTPNAVLKMLYKNLVKMFKTEESIGRFRREIMAISELRESAPKSKHHFIAYAQELWSQGIDPDLFIVLMSQKKAELESHTMDSVHALKNLAKYPPTLGMTGTVMGMITLFSSLDANKNSVGTALSIAMTATFMGLILANILISPLADRLHVRHVNQQRMLENMYELLLLINQGEPTALIREELNERAV
jgi:chemotaxis protein MotA